MSAAVQEEKEPPQPERQREPEHSFERPPERRSGRREREEPMQAPRPKLEGATSLRDALAQVSRKPEPKHEEPIHLPPQKMQERLPQAQRPEPAPDLKQVLKRMSEEHKKEQALREPPREATQEPNNQQEERPVGLPEDLMRAMLAVDDYGDEKR